MLQAIARLKLLAKGLLVSDIACIFGFQPFQEMQFAIEFHTKGVAGGSLCFHLFNSLKTGLTI